LASTKPGQADKEKRATLNDFVVTQYR